MRRFDTPAAPLGWAGQGADLIRIVDPTGRAIAWLAPGLGSNCVGYAVRRDDGTWRHLLHSGDPRDLRRDPLAHGCAILGPEPDGPGSAHRAAWQFAERDPTAATCTHQGGAIRLDLTARLEDAALHLALVATNVGPEPSPIAPGLRLCLADEFRRAAVNARHSPDLGAFVGEDATLRLTIAAKGEAAVQWRIDQLSGGRVAVEARSAATPGVPSAPDAQRRFALVVLPSW